MITLKESLRVGIITGKEDKMRELIKSSLNRYAKERIPTGSFLMAVLKNNLVEAICRADDDNRKDILEIVQYVYNELPGNCWGSPEIVKKWLSK